MEHSIETESIWRQFNMLPDEARREVIDFIAFLQLRYRRLNFDKHHQVSKLAEEPFLGIWKDRKDFTDSVEWVRDCRKREWVN